MEEQFNVPSCNESIIEYNDKIMKSIAKETFILTRTFPRMTYLPSENNIYAAIKDIKEGAIETKF